MCCATTGLALSLLFYVASSFPPTCWCVGSLGCAASAADSRGTNKHPAWGRGGQNLLWGWTTCIGHSFYSGDAGGRHNALTSRCICPRYSSLLVKANLGCVLERPETAHQVLRLCLRGWGFAPSNWIGWKVPTNEWGQLHLKIGLGWYLNL